MVLAENGKLYTGVAKDVDARFEKHQSGKGAKFFRSAKPVMVVYREQCRDKSDALKREVAIKKMTKNAKVALVRKYSLALVERLGFTSP